MVYEAAVLFAGLPAQWFAVIRRALELCFWNWALNPHAWVSSLLLLVVLFAGSEDAYSTLLGLFLFGPSPRLPLTQVRDGAVCATGTTPPGESDQ